MVLIIRQYHGLVQSKCCAGLTVVPPAHLALVDSCGSSDFMVPCYQRISYATFSQVKSVHSLKPEQNIHILAMPQENCFPDRDAVLLKTIVRMETCIGVFYWLI